MTVQRKILENMIRLKKLLQFGSSAIILGFVILYMNFYKPTYNTDKYHHQLFRDTLDSWSSKPDGFCSEHNVDATELPTRGTLKSREHEVRAFNCKVIPDILIVGMEKCGTAALRTFLGIHPQIHVPLPLKPNDFFARRFENFTLSEYFEYKKKRNKPLQCTPNGILRIEKVSNDAKHAERAYQYSRNMKLVAIVREPTERAMSHFVEYREGKIIPRNATFEESISEQTPYRRCPLYWSRYSDRLQTWSDVYGTDKILILDGDEFARNPVTGLKKVEDFVGISNFFRQEHFVYNKEKKFFCVVTDTIECMGDDKGRTHPVMRNETRTQLKQYLRPINERFYNMIGRRFDWDD